MMKKILFVLFLFIFPFPSFLFGQNPDNTCICGKQAPQIGKDFIVEEMPMYPGGYIALKNLIKTNIKLNSTENGRIDISFIISCKGNTCGFAVLNKEGLLSKDTEYKIIEILNRMDTWNPGKQGGRDVDVPFKISITITNGILKFNGALK
jgi:hypothetical protein